MQYGIIGKLLPKFITALVFILVLLIYWLFHPYLGDLLIKFAYWKLLAILYVLGVLGYFFVKKRSSLSVLTTTLLLFLGFIIIPYISLFNFFAETFITVKSWMVITKHLFGTGGFLILFTWTLYLFGQLILSLTSSKTSDIENAVISIALGGVAVALLLFFLGSFGLLNKISVWAIIIGIQLFSLKTTKNHLLRAKQAKIQVSKITPLQFAGIFTLLIFVSLSFMSIARPLPIGWDEIALYQNLPNLLFLKKQLVAGFSPYSASLLASIGHIVGGGIEYALAITFAGCIYSLLALWTIAKRFVSSSNSIWVCLIFYSLPIVIYQQTMDLKVDLWNLFYILIGILLLLKIFDKKLSITEQWSKSTTQEIGTLFIMLGIFIGFGISIKLTTLIFLFAAVLVLIKIFFNNTVFTIA